VGGETVLRAAFPWGRARCSAWTVDVHRLELHSDGSSTSSELFALRTTFQWKSVRYSVWIVDAPPGVVFGRKLCMEREIVLQTKFQQEFVRWIVDAPSGVAISWKCYVDRMIRAPEYVPMQVCKVLCVNSRCHARCCVEREALPVVCQRNASCVSTQNCSPTFVPMLSTRPTQCCVGTLIFFS